MTPVQRVTFLKHIKRNGPRGQVSQLGDYSPIAWRFRLALIIAVAVVLTVVTLIAHAV